MVISKFDNDKDKLIFYFAGAVSLLQKKFVS